MTSVLTYRVYEKNSMRSSGIKDASVSLSLNCTTIVQVSSVTLGDTIQCQPYLDRSNRNYVVIPWHEPVCRHVPLNFLDCRRQILVAFDFIKLRCERVERARKSLDESMGKSVHD